MATSTKAKRPKSSKAKPSTRLGSTERPKYDDENKPLYFPMVGESVGICLNKAPFWDDPDWGPYVVATIKEIRDLAIDQLKFEEFAEVATKNIGRYWITAESEEGKAIEFFWNDVRLHAYWPVGESHLRDLVFEPGVDSYDMDENSKDQPFARFNLRMIYRFFGNNSGEFMASDVVASPTVEDRLRLIESFGRARVAAEDCISDSIRVRPEVGA